MIHSIFKREFYNSLFFITNNYICIEKTMLLQLAYPTTSAIIPIKPELRRSPKVLWLDSGLINPV
ncbi:MAG: hypothetical protein WC960_06580 [Bacteroidales bacterium]